jgi:selenocysteine lyase/cysteine desulfurase
VSTPDWAALRREFPTLERWTYLDVARKTIPPRCQAQAMEAFTHDIYENAGADAWAATNVAETRAEMAQLLGAKPAELAFTKNTTEGLNVAAHAFDLKPGDNVVLTDMEHVANVWVWKQWEAKGVERRYARSRNARLPVEVFLEAIDARTRVVSTAWVTYGNGYRVDLPALGKACRARNIRLVVDGVQGAGIIATPLSELGADFISIGGHKALLGLTGTGLVYCREEVLNEVKTPFVKAAGEQKGKAHTLKQFDYMLTAHRFEGGNPNFLGLKVLREGARFLTSIGLENIEKRVRELTAFCLKELGDHGLASRTPDRWEERAHIVSVPAPDADALMMRLREKHRVVVNVKDNALRLSMSFFNNEEDIEKAVRAIKREMPARAA